MIRQNRGFSQPQNQNEKTKEPVARFTPAVGTNNLKVIPLGGCEEVGKNMTVYEYGNDIVILDMGLM